MMKIKRYISTVIIVALLIGLLPAKALNVKIGDIIEQQRVSQGLAQAMTQEEQAARQQEFLDIFYTVEDMAFSELTPEQQGIILTYCDITADEMEFWEIEGLTVSPSLSCVVVMRETGLTPEEMKIVQQAYRQVEDIIPALEQLKQYAAEEEIEDEVYADMRQGVLERRILNQWENPTGGIMAMAEEIPEPAKIDLSFVAPFSLQNGKNETVSVNTGSLSLSYPIVQIPGRSDLDVNLSLSYKSSDAALYQPAGSANSVYDYYGLAEYENYSVKNSVRTDLPNSYELLGPFSSKTAARNKLNELATNTQPELVSTTTESYTDTKLVEDILGFTRTKTSYRYVSNDKEISYSWSPDLSVPVPSGILYNSNGYSGSLIQDYSSPSSVRTNVSGSNPAQYKLVETWKVYYTGYVTKTIFVPTNYYQKYIVPTNVNDMIIADYAYTSSYAYTTSPTYGEKSGNLGAGWNWNLPSYDPDGKVLYRENGSSFALNNDLTIKDYPLSDIKFSADTTYTSTGNIKSSWKLSLADGLVWWFGPQGQPIGQTDRFNNRISYEYITGTYGYRLSKIVDTADRAITVVYSGNTISVTPPDGKAIILTLEDYSSDSNRKLLKSIKDAENQATVFEYSITDAPFSLGSYGTSTNRNANLVTVNHPTGGQTKYTYVPSTSASAKEGMGSGYWYTASKVESRWDVIGGLDYTKKTYTYTGSFTGYPTYTDASNLPNTYTYASSCTDANSGVYTLYTFNNKGLNVKEESSLAGVPLTSSAVEYTTTRLPEKTTNRIYSGATKYVEAITMAEYDAYGRATATWDANANGNRSNTEYKTTMTYDSTYGLPETKTYKTNSTTTILERYTLSTDKKSVSYYELLENNSLKQKTGYGYNGYGQITSQKAYRDDLVNFAETVYQYDTYGNLTQLYQTNVKNAAGALVTTPGLSSGCVGMVYDYDVMGRIKSQKDERGNTTQYAYDNIGQIKTVTNPDASTVSYVRDYAANKLTVTDEVGRKTRYEFNPFGYETLVWDDTAGAQVSKTTYDKKFRVETKQGAAGTAVTTFTYDALDRVLTQTSADSTGTLAKESFAYDVDTAIGQKTTQTIEGGKTGAPDQKLVQYTDKLGHVVREGHVNGSTEETATYVYDYLGRKIEEKSARAYEAAWPVTYTTKWEYGWDGQVSKQYNANGQSITFTYENPATGKVTKSYDYAGYESTARYDDMGRLIAEQKPVTSLNGTIHYAKTEYYYDRDGVSENLATVKRLISEPGQADKWQITQNYYSNRGFLTSTAMQTDAGGYETYAYTYDKIGRMLTMSNPLNQVTETIYTDSQHKETHIDPLKQTETTIYNVSGLPTSKTDRNGVAHSWKYDGLGRELTYRAGDKQRTASYSWAGQLLSESNETSTVNYQYDALGRVNYQKETSVDGDVVQSFTYYADNQRKTATLTVAGDGKITDYTYDRLGRLETVTADGETAVYTYDTNGNRKTLTVGALATDYNYNLANWLTSLENVIDGRLQSGYTYSYYLDGNQLTKTDTVTNQTVTYQYYLQGRLKEEEYTDGIAGDGFVAYTYDTAGNRKTMTDTRSGAQVTTLYDYDANNRLKTTEKTIPDGTIVTERFGYDANGNQISMMREVLQPADSSAAPSVSFGGGVYEVSAYDAFGQLTSIHNNNGSSEYTYNPTGLRHSKAVDGEKRVHVWDGSQMAAEVSGNSTTRYVRGVNLLWSVDESSKKSTYLYNAHGDVVALVGETGNVTWEYSYDAFGNQLEQGKPIAWELVDTSEDTNPFRYCGEYFDAETGSVYLRARYYNSTVGRFVSEDTTKARRMNLFDPHGYYQSTSLIGGVYQDSKSGQYIINDPLSLNLYSYAHSNPVMYQDPTGNAVANIVGGVVGGIAGAVLGVILADSFGLKGVARWAFIAAVTVAGVALGALIGPYIAKLTSSAIAAINAKITAAATAAGGGTTLVTSKFIDNIQSLYNKTVGHIFSADHIRDGIMKLGSNEFDIFNKLVNTVNQYSSKFVPGSNEIRTVINGSQVTIRFFIENGKIININGFIGYSERLIGTLLK